MQGVYSLDGDTLSYCIASAGQSWPTDFSAAEGSKRTLISLQRFPPGEHLVEAILKRANVRVAKNQEGWIVRLLKLPDLDDALAAEIAKLKKLESFKITGDRLTEEGLRSVASLENLKRLIMYQFPLTDAGVTEISRLKQIERLSILIPNLTDESLEQLSELKTLTSLSIYGAEGLIDRRGRMTDSPPNPHPELSVAGLKAISSLHNLELLSLCGIPVTDDGLSYFSNRTNLKSLYLSKTELTDAGLTHIATLSGLINLSLAYSAISDAGLRKLSQLTELRSLTIVGATLTDESLKTIVNSFPDLWQLRANRVAGLTDAGLLELSRLKQLKSLAVSQGQFSEATLAKLRAESSNQIGIQVLP